MAEAQTQPATESSEKNTAQSKASRFADILATMPLKELLLGSIKLNNKWTKLVQYDDNSRKLFKCNLCGIVQYGVKNIYAHISGKKHKNKMNEVTELYNPKFTPSTINLMTPMTTTTTLNNDTINSTNSATKSIATDAAAVGGNDKKSNENLILLVENKETNSNETTTTTTPSEEIIIVEEKEGDSEGKSNDSETPPVQEQDAEIVNEEMEVPNPFSQTNSAGGGGGGSGQCKIACVSLSKLIDSKVEGDNETADVIEISDNDNDDNPKSSNQQEGDKNNMNKNTESRARVQQQQPPQGPNNPLSSSSNINVSATHRPPIATPTTANPTRIQRRLSPTPLNKVDLIFDSDRIDRKMEILGFLGVEYVIKVLKRNDYSAPRFECSLCELILMGEAMQRHLLGYNHRLKYCQKHFPTAIRQYQQYMSDVPEHEIFKVMTPVLEKLAIAIEKHHGKFTPYKCYSSELETNRHDIFSKVYSRRHASEQHGPTFTHVLGAEEIRYLVQNRNNLHKPTSSGIDPNQPSGFNDQNYCGYNQPYFQYDIVPFGGGGGGQSYSHNQGPVLDNETHKMMVENFLKETSRNDPNDSEGRHQSFKRMASSHSTSIERKRLRSERISLSPLRDGDIWQAYRHMVDIKVYDLEKKYSEYKKDPEQHPRYNEEWQKFWKRRKDELIRSGIDHRLYNYQNEWSIFFKSHMNELYKQNIEEIKIQCRERLYLPMTNDELSDPKYHVVNNDINDNSSDDEVENNEEQPQQINNYNKGREKEQLISDNNTNINTEDQNKSSPPDLIHVLRILAALEEHLGSLGPKITDMLSKALLLSKFSPGGIEDSFLTRANCIILETCVEKFKGFLYAGLTDTTKKRALNKAIDETEAFLKNVMPKLIEEEKNTMKLSQLSRKLSEVEQSTTATTTKRLSPQKRSLPQRLGIEKAMPMPPSNVVSQTIQHSNRQDTIQTSTSSLATSNQQQSDDIRNDLTESEKSELASKLAATLVAKGRGDFSPEQIRKILDIYFAIINKKSAGGSLIANPVDEARQDFLFNTIITSFINQNQTQKTSSSQMTNQNQQQQQQYGNMNRNENPRTSQTNQNQNQQLQQYGNINRDDNPRTSQMTNQYGNINRNDNNPRTSQMTNLNQNQQQQQYFNMNSNQNPRTNHQQMSTLNQQQLLQQLQLFTNKNSNQNSNIRSNEVMMMTSNQQQQQNASQSKNNIMPNNMNYQQQQSNINMRSFGRGGGGGGGGSGPNLAASATATTALPNLMNTIRSINMNNTSSEQNLRQNVPSSFMNNLNNQYSSNNQYPSTNNFQSQGFGGINRGSGGGGGGGGMGAFNQQLPSLLNNLNNATQKNNSNNSNNNWSRMMNSGNNQPINNQSNQYRGRNPENMNNTNRQSIWKRN